MWMVQVQVFWIRSSTFMFVMYHSILPFFNFNRKKIDYFIILAVKTVYKVISFKNTFDEEIFFRLSYKLKISQHPIITEWEVQIAENVRLAIVTEVVTSEILLKKKGALIIDQRKRPEGEKKEIKTLVGDY